MADELKPCPFCGGSAVKFWDNEWLRAVVECSNCGATTARQDDYPEAIAAWNTRAAPQPEPSEVVPEGWQLVPIIPTPAMDKVMMEEEWSWDELLAAAPQPPAIAARRAAKEKDNG